jgi:hypothetical protein
MSCAAIAKVLLLDLDWVTLLELPPEKFGSVSNRRYGVMSGSGHPQRRYD